MDALLIIFLLITFGTLLANLGLTQLNFKLYTEYWKDSTIKARYYQTPQK